MFDMLNKQKSKTKNLIRVTKNNNKQTNQKLNKSDQKLASVIQGRSNDVLPKFWNGDRRFAMRDTRITYWLFFRSVPFLLRQLASVSVSVVVARVVLSGQRKP